jgi:hypothetical protein
MEITCNPISLFGRGLLEQSDHAVKSPHSMLDRLVTVGKMMLMKLK